MRIHLTKFDSIDENKKKIEMKVNKDISVYDGIFLSEKNEEKEISL